MPFNLDRQEQFSEQDSKLGKEQDNSDKQDDQKRG